MGKTLLLSLITLLCFNSYAQNYRCVQPGAKHYFINDGNYLRGIRVDSVRISGTDTIIYPFRSPRGRYELNQKLNMSSGSWLGKTIIEKQDGTSLFDNYWGDTVVIKTRAALYDKWIFYDDTTKIFYEAEVTRIDTQTINGQLDSVKTITLWAKDNNGVVSSDVLNNTQILISKSFGFVQVCDLYIFPLHEPGKPYKRGFDYFLDNYCNTNSSGKINYIFRLTDFHSPTNFEINDFHIGDEFGYSYYNYGGSDIISRITILQKDTISSNEIKYTYDQIAEYKDHSSGMPKYYTNRNVVSSSTNAALLLDTTYMPEESTQPDAFWYYPDDTSFCYKSKAYEYFDNFIFAADSTVNTFEPCGHGGKYKIGIGVIVYNRCFDPTPGYQSAQYLGYVKKDGKECGGKHYFNISDVKEQQTIVYPNPASEVINIDFQQNNKPYTIKLLGTDGRLIKKADCTGTSKLDVRDVPDGIYYLLISADGVKNNTSKIVIRH